jgi:dTDP-4-amino-4,6-dideoxygalactose transaminase
MAFNLFVITHKLHPFTMTNAMAEYFPNSDRFDDCLVRLPFYYDLSESDLEYICEEIKIFYQK